MICMREKVVTVRNSSPAAFALIQVTVQKNCIDGDLGGAAKQECEEDEFQSCERSGSEGGEQGDNLCTLQSTSIYTLYYRASMEAG